MRGERRMRRQQPLQQQKLQQVCLTCLLGEEWCFNCGEPWHISPGTFPIWQEEGTWTEVRRRRRQRGKVERGEEEWCTNCMRYRYEEHHCLEVFQDTDLERESVRPQPKREETELPQPKREESVHPQPKREEAERPQPKKEEPVCPQPKRGEAEHPQPKKEEPVRPQPKRGKAERPKSRYPPAEGECLLVLPPSPSPAEGACLLVPLLLPFREPEWVEPVTQEPEGEKAEAPQQPLHMLLRGTQGRRIRLRRQEVPARLQRPLEWPQPPPPLPECLEPLPLEELELPLPEWPPSPPVVPEGPPVVPEGPLAVPEGLPTVPEGPASPLAVREEFLFLPHPPERDEPPFSPPPAEGDELLFLPPPAERDELQFPPPPEEGDELLFPPPPAEGDELLFLPPPPEGVGPPFQLCLDEVGIHLET
ncbi:UNVERIFIED_CONTAM: hypothetical protein FKN15_061807 [Acipenser sinensis]